MFRNGFNDKITINLNIRLFILERKRLLRLKKILMLDKCRVDTSLEYQMLHRTGGAEKF
jgi:hypothetical protein